MESLRKSAAALPEAPELIWSKAGDENADEMCDWSVRVGTSGLYKVHSALFASGPRRSEVARSAVLKAAVGASRVTDVAQLITNEKARELVLKDPHLLPTVELLLDWMYGKVSHFNIPTFGGGTVAGGLASSASASSKAASGGPPSLTHGESSMYDYFSTALFGTPSKQPSQSKLGAVVDAAKKQAASVSAPGTPAASSAMDVSDPRTAPPAAKGGSSARGGTPYSLKPEQIPLLWQLAGALGVRGLKASLSPLFEHEPLGERFVMEKPAFERLKLLVRALELNNEEIVGALCEELRINAATKATLKDGMVELAVAACCCSASRYESLVGTGLVPSDNNKLITEILDKTGLRVANESQVHDFLLKHFAASKPSAEVQASLWATCRFSYLQADRLVKLSEVPNVPPRWLALACAQKAAPGAAPPTTGMKPEELARLKPRDTYKK